MSEPLKLWVVQIITDLWEPYSPGTVKKNGTIVKAQHVFDTEEEADNFILKTTIQDHSYIKFPSVNHCDPGKMMKSAMDRFTDEMKKRNTGK